MEGCRNISGGYTWQNCEDFQVPDNSVWFGRDDDGSDIFCGKAWCDGEEVPAKVIPNRRECRINNNGCETVVPNCRKVLICEREGNAWHGQGDYCHTRRPHCNSSRGEINVECYNSSRKSTTNNESKLLEKNMRSCSSCTSTVVRKNTKRQDQGVECWYEWRTRMVPKVTVQQRVRYIPNVINEKNVRYVQERYRIRVCGKRSCRPCEPYAPCEPWGPRGPCESRGPCERSEPNLSYNPCEPCDSCRKDRTDLFSPHLPSRRIDCY